MNKRSNSATRLWALLLTTGVAGAAAACNAIIGLEPGELAPTGSSGVGPAAGSGGADVSTSAGTGTTATAGGSTTGGSTSSTSTSSTGGGSTCPGPSKVPCGDHTWAHWHAEPGATCADRFVVIQGEVSDKVTGLVWQQTSPLLTPTWDFASTYCAGLATATEKWRLPTRIELLSIVDFAKASLMLDASVFTGQTGDAYWTASPYAGDSSKAWFVAFKNLAAYPNAVGYDAKSSMHYVRCVR